MTDQPKVYCDDPLGNRNGPTAAARHRWVVALLTLALSGGPLGGATPQSHSPNAAAAVKPASGPASTGSPAAPASPGSPSAPASAGSPTGPTSPSSSGSPALVTYLEDLQ